MHGVTEQTESDSNDHDDHQDDSKDYKFLAVIAVEPSVHAMEETSGDMRDIQQNDCSRKEDKVPNRLWSIN